MALFADDRHEVSMRAKYRKRDHLSDVNVIPGQGAAFPNSAYAGRRSATRFLPRTATGTSGS